MQSSEFTEGCRVRHVQGYIATVVDRVPETDLVIVWGDHGKYSMVQECSLERVNDRGEPYRTRQ